MWRIVKLNGKTSNGMFKINFDVFFYPLSRIAVANLVVRDWKGRLLFAKMHRQEALFVFVHQPWKMFRRAVWFEPCAGGNYKELIFLLYSTSKKIESGLIKEIIQYFYNFACFDSQYTWRDINKYVYQIANEVAGFRQKSSVFILVILPYFYILRKNRGNFFMQEDSILIKLFEQEKKTMDVNLKSKTIREG